MPDVKIGDAAKQVAALFTQAGLKTVVDSRDLELPGAWLTVNSMSFDRLDAATYEGTWDLFLVAPDVAAPDALDQLGKLLAQARAAGFDTGQANAVTVTLPNHSPNPLPALQLQVVTTIQETD